MSLVCLLFVRIAFGETPSGGVSASVVEDFEIRYYRSVLRAPNNPDVPVFNYVEQVNRVNVSVSKDPVTIEAQIDEVALLANQYYFNDVLVAERQLLQNQVFNLMPGFSYLNPEKLRLRVEMEKSSWVVGDAYAAFGRGIALNLNRNVDIDIDTSVQGVKGVLRPGAWDFTVVAGQLNRQQVFQDNPNILIPPDRRHTVAGVRAERFGLGNANIGAHGVMYNFVDDVGFGRAFEAGASTPDALVGGLTAEVLGLGGVDWYAEADVFGFPSDDLLTTLNGAEKKPGHAAYLSSAFYPGKTAWLVEAKRYYQAERINSNLTQELYEVGIAPTLEYERAITEDSSATVNSNDIWGGRVVMDYVLKPGELVPYVSVGVFRDAELGGLHFNDSPETVVHTMLGMELIREESAALVNVGYRLDERDVVDQGRDQQLHGDAAIKFPFVAGLHAEVQLSAEYYQWGNNAFQQDDYVEAESGLTVQRGSTVALTWYTDFTKNPLVNSTGNLSEPLYGALELQVKPSSAITLKAFYGAYKAGIRCSGGQCRQLPGFDGARFACVGTF